MMFLDFNAVLTIVIEGEEALLSLEHESLEDLGRNADLDIFSHEVAQS